MMKYVLSFRERRVGGAVVPPRLEVGQGLGSWADLPTERRLVFLLHGYNVDAARGRASLLELSDFLRGGEWGLVATLWPGDHGLGAISYSFEGRGADDTAAELARFVQCWAGPEARVSFVGHSLGCRVVLETVKRLIGKTVHVDEVCLFAAAVDADSLASWDSYRSCCKRAGRVTVLSSRRDRVLKLAYPAGDLLQAFLFSEDDFGFALGYRGPRDHKGREVPEQVAGVEIPKRFGVDHGDYFPSVVQEDVRRQRQRAAARFADSVLAGLPVPRYESVLRRTP